jgi:hypothetical protein
MQLRNRNEWVNTHVALHTYARAQTRELTREFHDYFREKVNVSRIKHGKRQEIESMINEEAFLLARYLRDERKAWTPRIVELSN